MRSGKLEEARSEPEWGGDVRGATELQNPKTQVHGPRDLKLVRMWDRLSQFSIVDWQTLIRPRKFNCNENTV